MSAKITQLISYPIKSCAGIRHDSIEIGAMGLWGDRQWMLVDENGIFLSQRKHPKMALIQPQLTANVLTLNAPKMSPIQVDLHTPKSIKEVTVWKDTLNADGFDASVNQWFADYLHHKVRLVGYGKQSHRLIDPAYANKGQTVAFADGYPLLITHQATLDNLNQHLSSPVGMDRFRPNIVIHSEDAPWAELYWQQLRSDDCFIRLVKPCTRCVMTGVEQQTGIQTGTEVLKTLRQQFTHQDKAVFGINGIADISNSEATQLVIGQELKIQQESHRQTQL